MKVNLRNIAGWAFACILINMGLVKRSLKRASNGEYVLSVYFHNPSEKEFETSIKWLKKNNFQFLSTSELELIIHNRLPLPKKAIVITADDGWRSNRRNIVGIAEKYKVPVTIFISTEPVEQGTYWWSYFRKTKGKHSYLLPISKLKKVSDFSRLKEVAKAKESISVNREALTIEEVKWISESAYVTVGGHTHTHPILINCVDSQVFEELKVSREKLESWTGKNVTYFAYPNGDYGPREIDTLQSLGYTLSFCSEPRHIALNDLNNYYQLPRCGFLEGASIAENICRIVGVWHSNVNRLKLFFLQKEANPPVNSTDRISKSGLVMLDN